MTDNREYLKTFVTRLRDSYERGGWTRHRIADIAGVGVNAVKAWENGTGFPQRHSLARLKGALPQYFNGVNGHDAGALVVTMNPVLKQAEKERLEVSLMEESPTTTAGAPPRKPKPGSTKSLVDQQIRRRFVRKLLQDDGGAQTDDIQAAVKREFGMGVSGEMIRSVRVELRLPVRATAVIGNGPRPVASEAAPLASLSPARSDTLAPSIEKVEEDVRAMLRAVKEAHPGVRIRLIHFEDPEVGSPTFSVRVEVPVQRVEVQDGGGSL